jgi:hypothetical protein
MSVSLGLIGGVGKKGHTKQSLRIHKLWSICMVEIRDALSCELKVLRLVFADWDMCCSFFLISLISTPTLCPSHLSPLLSC